MGGAVADAGDAKGKSLPEIVVIDLGDGDVELVGDEGNEGAGDASFFLEVSHPMKSQG